MQRRSSMPLLNKTLDHTILDFRLVVSVQSNDFRLTQQLSQGQVRSLPSSLV
ncbi:hypothetical protein [Nostoc sp.]